MRSHWEVTYEPNLWWAWNDGVCVMADTPQEWDDIVGQLAQGHCAREAEDMMTDGLG